MELPKFEVIDSNTDLSPNKREDKKENGLRLTSGEEIPNKFTLITKILAKLANVMMEDHLSILQVAFPSAITTNFTFLQGGINGLTYLYPYIK